MRNQRSTSLRRSPRRAFTLIEMMIVMGMIAIFLSIGIPSFARAQKRAPFRQAAIDLQDGLSNARAQAILRGASMEFTITAEDGHMSIRPISGTEAEIVDQESTEVSPWGESKFDAYLPSDVGVELLDVNGVDQMDATIVRVRFHPNGTCDEFAIVIKSIDGERRLFKLDVMTGRAMMESDPNKFTQL